MAGVKGRSGGARKNTGGARKGAGRKPKFPRATPPTAPAKPPAAPSTPAAPPLQSTAADAKDFLERVIRGEVVPTREQLEAAKAVLPFQHKKLGETGKKEEQRALAGRISRFTPAPPPRLATLSGKKV